MHIVSRTYHVSWTYTWTHFVHFSPFVTLWTAMTQADAAFDPRPVHVGFVLAKVALGEVFLRVLRSSSVSVSPSLCSYIYLPWGCIILAIDSISLSLSLSLVCLVGARNWFYSIKVAYVTSDSLYGKRVNVYSYAVYPQHCGNDLVHYMVFSFWSRFNLFE
jgi:hypothetical protein